MEGGYTDNNFLVLDVYLNEKGPSLKIQWLNISKDHHIVAYSRPTAIDYVRWTLSDALWTKFYRGHGKYKSKLGEYF